MMNPSLAETRNHSTPLVERMLTDLRFDTLFRTVERVYGKRFETLPGMI